MWRAFLTFSGAGVKKDQRYLVFHMKGIFMRHVVFLCQPKVEMSPFLPDRDVPFLKEGEQDNELR
jgi:hypothetical protein